MFMIILNLYLLTIKYIKIICIIILRDDRWINEFNYLWKRKFNIK